MDEKFQPTPSLRRATPAHIAQYEPHRISTHALLAEGDAVSASTLLSLFLFQPTPSLRRATTLEAPRAAVPENFNPRPPCGGRRPVVIIQVYAYLFQPTPSLRRATEPGNDGLWRARISTHALLAEGDTQGAKTVTPTTTFQPTPSLRRATAWAGSPHHQRLISTHALLAEGDAMRLPSVTFAPYFNPRPPCGGRRPQHRGGPRHIYFNPRPPCGGRRQT